MYDEVDRVRLQTFRKRLARFRRKLFHRPDSSIDAAQLIRDSGLFDPAWYLETYADVAEAGLDPLAHFVAYGGFEGRKASPAFDSRWYMNTYPDVRGSHLHPLVHYLRHGQGRTPIKRVGLKRMKTTEEDFGLAAEILTSSLFNAGWYAREHGLENQSPTVAALHYLAVGAPSGEAAGPDFDTAAYLRAYSDVKDAGVNALLHFHRYGAAEGRRAFTVQEALQERLSFSDRTDRVARPSPVSTSTPWRQGRSLRAGQGKSLARFGGVAVGLLRDVYDDQTEPLSDSLARALREFCQVCGLEPHDVAQARSGRLPRRIPATSSAPNGADPRVVDGWFVSDSLLRLRFERSDQPAVVRLLQAADGGRLQLVGEAPLIDGEQHFVDVLLWNPLEPVLIVYAQPNGRLSGGGLMAFPSLFRNGLHHAEVAATGTDGDISRRREWLHDSLLRQWLASRERSDFAIGRLEIDTLCACGAEPIFSAPVRQWLGRLGVGLQPSSQQSLRDEDDADYLTSISQSAPEVARSAEGVLALAADSLPTLQALFARRADYKRGGAGALLLSDAAGIPRWSVSFPLSATGLSDLQPAGAPLVMPRLRLEGGVNTTAGRLGPLAIRTSTIERLTDARSIYPVAPDSDEPVLYRALSARQKTQARILTLVDSQGGGAALVEALARQTLASALRIVMVYGVGQTPDAPTQEALTRLFPASHQVVGVPGRTFASRMQAAVKAVSTGRNDALLFCRTDINPHDARTLETLYLLVMEKNVATSGCAHVREGSFRDGRRIENQSAGLFPRKISLDARPSLTFAEAQTAEALPLATYPVAGNTMNFAMTTVKVWNQLGGFDPKLGDDSELDFCLRALKAGYSHLCTSSVSVTNTQPATFASTAEHHSTQNFDLEELAKLVDRMTLFRALV